MFILHKHNSISVLLVYVDDMILVGNDVVQLQVIKTFLSSQFKVKDLGALKYFVGIEIARSDAGIYLNQRKYTLDLLKDTGCLDCKPSSLPLQQNHALLTSQDVPDISDVSLYRRIVGRLIYLTISRPDIAYTMHTLSQFLAHPKPIHLQATYRLLRYLKGTCGQGIFL